MLGKGLVELKFTLLLVQNKMFDIISRKQWEETIVHYIVQVINLQLGTHVGF